MFAPEKRPSLWRGRPLTKPSQGINGRKSAVFSPRGGLKSRRPSPVPLGPRLLQRRGHLSRCSCLWTHRPFVVAQRSARGVHGTSAGLTDWRPLVARARPTGATRIYNAVSEPRAQQVPSGGGGGPCCLGVRVRPSLADILWLDGSQTGPEFGSLG